MRIFEYAALHLLTNRLFNTQNYWRYAYYYLRTFEHNARGKSKAPEETKCLTISRNHSIGFSLFFVEILKYIHDLNGKQLTWWGFWALLTPLDIDTNNFEVLNSKWLCWAWKILFAIVCPIFFFKEYREIKQLWSSCYDHTQQENHLEHFLACSVKQWVREWILQAIVVSFFPSLVGQHSTAVILCVKKSSSFFMAYEWILSNEIFEKCCCENDFCLLWFCLVQRLHRIIIW